jgi:hypothetical protein
VRLSIGWGKPRREAELRPAYHEAAASASYSCASAGANGRQIATHTSKRGHAGGGSPLRRKRPLWPNGHWGAEASVSARRVRISLAMRTQPFDTCWPRSPTSAVQAIWLSPCRDRRADRPDGAAGDRVRPAPPFGRIDWSQVNRDGHEPVPGPMVQRQLADRPELLAKLRTCKLPATHPRGHGEGQLERPSHGVVPTTVTTNPSSMTA